MYLVSKLCELNLGVNMVNLQGNNPLSIKKGTQMLKNINGVNLIFQRRMWTQNQNNRKLIKRNKIIELIVKD